VFFADSFAISALRLVNRLSPVACCVFLSGCSVTPVASTTATLGRMSEGAAVVDDLSERWWITGSAGHAGKRQDSVWRIKLGRLELCDGSGRSCRPVATDGVLPDTLVVPAGEAPAGGEATANAIWVRALPQGAIRGGKGALAYCVAEEGVGSCRAATFPQRRDVMRGVIANLRLRMPQPRDVVWVALSGLVARCSASPARPEPRCVAATMIDPAFGVGER
jgi:hypothetical protein